MRISLVPLLFLITPAAAQLGSGVRGTNYLADTYACGNLLLQFQPNDAPVPGTYVASVVEDELARIAAAGFTSVRVFGSFHGWLLDRDGHARGLADFLDRCARHGLKVSFILWNGFGGSELEAVLRSHAFDPRARAHPELLVVPREGESLERDGAPVRAMGFHAAPGNRLLGEHRSAGTHPHPQLYVEWVVDVTAAFRARPGLLLCYDLFNESEVAVGSGATHEAIRELAAVTALVLRALDPGAPIVMGEATIDGAIEAFDRLRADYGVTLSALTFHCYAEPPMFADTIARARREAERRGVPALVTEFHMPASQGGLDLLLWSLHSEAVGGQMWGYLEDRLIQAFTPLPEPAWVANSGVLRRSAPDLFPVKNQAYERAVRDWCAFREPAVRPLRLEASALHPGEGPAAILRIDLAGPDLPLLLLASPLRTEGEHLLLPGVGVLAHRGALADLAVVPLPPPGLPGRTIRIVVPDATPLRGHAVVLQALMGYDGLAGWEAHAPQLTAPVTVGF